MSFRMRSEEESYRYDEIPQSPKKAHFGMTN